MAEWNVVWRPNAFFDKQRVAVNLDIDVCSMNKKSSAIFFFLLVLILSLIYQTYTFITSWVAGNRSFAPHSTAQHISRNQILPRNKNTNNLINRIYQTKEKNDINQQFSFIRLFVRLSLIREAGIQFASLYSNPFNKQFMRRLCLCSASVRNARCTSNSCQAKVCWHDWLTGRTRHRQQCDRQHTHHTTYNFGPIVSAFSLFCR